MPAVPATAPSVPAVPAVLATARSVPVVPAVLAMAPIVPAVRPCGRAAVRAQRAGHARHSSGTPAARRRRAVGDPHATIPVLWRRRATSGPRRGPRRPEPTPGELGSRSPAPPLPSLGDAGRWPGPAAAASTGRTARDPVPTRHGTGAEPLLRPGPAPVAWPQPGRRRGTARAARARLRPGAGRRAGYRVAGRVAARRQGVPRSGTARLRARLAASPRQPRGSRAGWAGRSPAGRAKRTRPPERGSRRRGSGVRVPGSREERGRPAGMPGEDAGPRR